MMVFPRIYKFIFSINIIQILVCRKIKFIKLLEEETQLESFQFKLIHLKAMLRSL